MSKGKIVINPEYQEAREWIEGIESFFDSSGEVLQDKRNVIKRYVTEYGTFVVKRYKRANILRRFVYTFFRASKAKRAYLYALEFNRREISTPDPVAYIERSSCGLFERGYFISLNLDWPMVLSFFSDAEGRRVADIESSSLIDGLSEYIVKMHERGIFHGDMNLSNFLYSKGEGEHYEFSVLDINRSHFCEMDIEHMKRCAQNLIRLTPKRELLSAIVKRYVALRGWESTDFAEMVNSMKDKFERRRGVKRRLKNMLPIA